MLDPIDRVFLPRADIATETLVAGLTELGWEVDDVTAYRTVRAAPPPAEIRDAIKGGGFDAVLFTSSLDGAQPRRHRGQAARRDRRRRASARRRPRPRRSTACGWTSCAPEPLGRGARRARWPSSAPARRLAMVAAGEPVTKPSAKRRRTSARRKAT